MSMYVEYPQRAEEVVRTPENGVTSHCQPSCCCWESNLGFLKSSHHLSSPRKLRSLSSMLKWDSQVLALACAWEHVLGSLQMAWRLVQSLVSWQYYSVQWRRHRSTQNISTSVCLAPFHFFLSIQYKYTDRRILYKENKSSWEMVAHAFGSSTREAERGIKENAKGKLSKTWAMVSFVKNKQKVIRRGKYSPTAPHDRDAQQEGLREEVGSEGLPGGNRRGCQSRLHHTGSTQHPAPCTDSKEYCFKGLTNVVFSDSRNSFIKKLLKCG